MQLQTGLLEQFEPLVRGRPDATVALARQFAAAGDLDTAIALAADVSTSVRADSEAGVLCAELLGREVPAWHFVIVRDKLRNEAYEGALRRAITPGCLVLEIGTGTGILAMMAARAGARVVTCEANLAVAATARQIIAANGLADRIAVVGKHSTALDPETDMGERADILVSEIVSNDLLSEGVRPAHADAVARLLKPSGQVIPAAGSVRAALAFDSSAASRRMGIVSGFDLRAFNRLARPCYEIEPGRQQLELRSNPSNVFTFDFGTSEPAGDRRSRLSLASSGGIVNGIVQWISLNLDTAGRYENQPKPSVSSCWAALFWPFAESLPTCCGDIIEIGAYCTHNRVRMWQITT
nr:methyltransferase domain-containing protein [uncultured Rhodoferax sp.]